MSEQEMDNFLIHVAETLLRAHVFFFGEVNVDWPMHQPTEYDGHCIAEQLEAEHLGLA